MQRKNCYIVDSCSRSCGKGQRPKNHSNAKGLAGRDCRSFKALFIPPLSPNPSPPPPGGSGELNNRMWPTLCAGWRSRANANIQTCREPRELGTTDADAACVHFECWPGTVNAAPLKTRPHPAVGPPFPPGGAGEGLGVRVGVAAQELLHR